MKFPLTALFSLFLAGSNAFADFDCNTVLYERFQIAYHHPGNIFGKYENTMFLEFDDLKGFIYEGNESGYGMIDTYIGEVGKQKTIIGFNRQKRKHYSCDAKRKKCIKFIGAIIDDLDKDFLKNVIDTQENLELKTSAIKCAIQFAKDYKQLLLGSAQ